MVKGDYHYFIVFMWSGGGRAVGILLEQMGVVAEGGTWWEKELTLLLGISQQYFGFPIKICLFTSFILAYLILLQLPAEPDGSRFSLPVRCTSEESGQQGSNQSQLTTPER